MGRSSVTNMRGMFVNSTLNGDISKWDISNARDTSYMFHAAKFPGQRQLPAVSHQPDLQPHVLVCVAIIHFHTTYPRCRPQLAELPTTAGTQMMAALAERKMRTAFLLICCHAGTPTPTRTPLTARHTPDAERSVTCLAPPAPPAPASPPAAPAIRATLATSPRQAVRGQATPEAAPQTTSSQTPYWRLRVIRSTSMGRCIRTESPG